MKRSLNIIFLGALIAASWFFRSPILSAVGTLESRYLPCLRPMSYHVATLDKEFGLSQEELLSALDEAEAVWEKRAGKELFRRSEGERPGSIAVSLIYDDRQAATNRLKDLGLAIDDSRRTYDSLSDKYNTLKSEYDTEKAELDRLLSSYRTAKQEYEAKVNYWNKRGGAPRTVYTELETERQALNRMGQEIKAAESRLNELADNINAAVVVLNQIAADLNLTAKTFNRIGQSEFEEGLYTSDISGRKIDIYQFDTRTKLVRVLAHELGHALGLEHVDDPEAIMYRLNQGDKEELTEADLAALKTVCVFSKI